MDGDGHVYLPEDVVFEIILRLPVISIARFKCVCRHWYDVIESREFREQHYALQNKSPLLAVEHYSGAAKIFSGKSLRVMENLQMPVWGFYAASPCRGLFLLHNGPSLGLLNLATRAFRLLPRMPNAAISDSQHFAYGLGWDPGTDDYKVVFFLYRHQVAAVYSLNSDSWRLLDSPPPKLSTGHIFNHISEWNIHTNGFCYWLRLFAKDPSLISFNVAQENFVTITLPPNVNNNNYTVLSTYYDSLGLLAWEKETGVMEVWVLRQEQQHYWTKVYSFRQTDSTICAIGIWNNTHVLLKKYVVGSKELFAYDMKNDHYEEKVKIPESITCFLNYKKSLFSIQGGSKDWIASQSSNHIHHFFKCD